MKICACLSTKIVTKEKSGPEEPLFCCNSSLPLVSVAIDGVRVVDTFGCWVRGAPAGDQSVPNTNTFWSAIYAPDKSFGACTWIVATFAAVNFRITNWHLILLTQNLSAELAISLTIAASCGSLRSQSSLRKS